MNGRVFRFEHPSAQSRSIEIMETKNQTQNESCCTKPVAAKTRPVSFCGFEKAAGPNGGMVVQSADKTSSAAKAGILAGDEILAVNGTRTTDASQTMGLLQAAGVGATVMVTLARTGQPLEVPMVIQAKSLALDLDDLDEVVERKIAPAAS
jgi:S1-C subfamily serine protease